MEQENKPPMPMSDDTHTFGGVSFLRVPCTGWVRTPQGNILVFLNTDSMRAWMLEKGNDFSAAAWVDQVFVEHEE